MKPKLAAGLLKTAIRTMTSPTKEEEELKRLPWLVLQIEKARKYIARLLFPIKWVRSCLVISYYLSLTSIAVKTRPLQKLVFPLTFLIPRSNILLIVISLINIRIIVTPGITTYP
jgi:hypothetical protein